MGVDLLSCKDKICSFNCIYCQIGETSFYTTERKVFVPTERIIKEINALPEIKIDYITFSGRGEPTLAKNLGEAIKEVRKIRKEPIAVLTNSALLPLEEVRRELLPSDLVSCKIDASQDSAFALINRPDGSIKFESILEGIKKFRKMYKKKLALQIMFVRENKNEAKELATIASDIGPDEIHINTPLRPSGAKALSKSDILRIKGYFRGLSVISVYDRRRPDIIPINKKETLRRRGGIE